jgi:bis(5'-adenosyl)-triphosphatase
LNLLEAKYKINMHDTSNFEDQTNIVEPPPAPSNSMPPLPLPANLKFGPFQVVNQVFHLSRSRLTYGLVNLKPLLPGHVLICPVRSVPRLSQLSIKETTDLFNTVQIVSRTLERVYRATAFNVAVQDGVDSGQSVPHVHVHIIPRQAGDLDDRGGGDQIYEMMDGDEGDVGKAFLEMQKARQAGNGKRRDFASGPDSDRKSRSEEEMMEEAEWLRVEMEKDVQEGNEV